jgi:hypothetical protein
MRIDPKASIRGVPVLQLRKLVRALNSRLSWDLETIQAVLSVTPREAEHMLSALEAADLARPRRRKGSKRKSHRFAGIVDRELWWRSETFRFLKGRSRSMSVLDYKRERGFVGRVPHRTLLCTAEDEPEPTRRVPKQARLARRPKGCPF